jgi:hypothetical protein
VNYQERKVLEEKITELTRTIQFLTNTMTNAADEVDTNPGMAKMMLRDSVADSRYEYK